MPIKAPKVVPLEAPRHTFGWALDMLKGGSMVTRAGWNGANQRLSIQKPDELSRMSLPYIFIRTVQGELVPWVASQTDILAEDWEIVNIDP
jgi:hypothetical protein